MIRREAVPRLALTRSVIWETFCPGRSKRTRTMSFEIGSLSSGRITSGVSPPWSRRSPANLRYRSVVFLTSLRGLRSTESIFSRSLIRLFSSLTSSAKSFSTVPGYSGGYKELLHQEDLMRNEEKPSNRSYGFNLMFFCTNQWE